MPNDLSVIIIAKNEERVIRKTLESVHGWAAEIIVLDSGSSDNTVAICREYTDKVFETDWPGYGPQKNRALDKASKGWVLSLDADESATEALKTEIDGLLAKAGGPVAYKVPVRLFYFGRYIRSLLKKRPIILFRREHGRFTDAPVHEHIVVSGGKVGKARHPILHDSYEDLYHQSIKLTKYADLWARQAHERGRRASILSAVNHAGWMLFRGIVLERAVLDGWRGVLLACVHAQYTFNKYAILTSLSRADG